MTIFTKHTVLLLTMSLLLCMTSLKAQSWDDIVRDKDTWLYGEGSGSTIEKAQAAALKDLTGKITTTVAGTFEIIEDEKTSEGDIDASTYISSKVSTYSNATLTNTDHLDKPDGNEWFSLYFIKRSEVNKIFEGRNKKVMDFVRLGEKAESQYQVGDALKYYYWAFTLLKTMQYPNEVEYEDEMKAKHILVTYLPYKMDNIFNDIRASVAHRDEDVAELSFTFRGQPVVGMEYSFHNGRNYSNIYSVKDGRGDVELPAGFSPEYLQLKIEYAYHQDAKRYGDELMAVQDIVNSRTLSKSFITIPFGKDKVQPSPVPVVYPSEQVTTRTGKAALVELDDDAPYREKADQVIAAIRAKNPHRIDGLFTNEGLELYNQLLNYGTARIYGEPDYKVYRKGDEVVVRSIPMSFSFQKGARKSIIEDVVLYFDDYGKISWLSFALDKKAADDIINKGVWSDTVRRTILSFMEDYKTAYCLERTKYLDKIFSDDALIIVGHVLKTLKRTDENDRISYRNNELVKKTQYNKVEYLDHLQTVFNNNECINIHFADNEITKAGKGGETFGIQIKQDYYSTTYGDSGWLFLVVDFNKPGEPTILVRVWQEEPDPEFGLVNLQKLQ